MTQSRRTEGGIVKGGESDKKAFTQSNKPVKIFT